ncbi:hypothetical protein Poli38472_014325 [Pythium oligandrum]|uniref:Globin domain-containing protein n=1 Tax=Pythium oligandrum TaxID=41045 RepID=A0A8K1FFJ5_PYTOL|nr:hypothetical protein Poli38472_014325 [Pythium oligandrum]|eukprot:TMW57722.1 hypothetical protein Poli38472_014325 [Pythium oligandrum]
MGCVSSTFLREGDQPKFSKQYCRIVKRYLPNFIFVEPSNNDDRLVAFAHWEQTYKDTIHSEKTAADSAVGKLYAAFYEHLFEHAAQLKPLFQASHAVQSRVLTHISTGMKSLLSSEDLVQKVMHLALVHMKIGVKADDFDPLGEALIQAMKKTTGAAWTERIELAWRRIYCHAAILILVNIPNVHIDLDDFKDDPAT